MSGDGLQLIRGQVGYGAMLRSGEIGPLHEALVEVADVLVGHEVCGFAETHVVGAGAVDIVHQHVGVGPSRLKRLGASVATVSGSIRCGSNVHPWLILLETPCFTVAWDT